MTPGTITITLRTAPARTWQYADATETAAFFAACERLLAGKRHVRIVVTWRAGKVYHSGETVLSRLADGRIRASWRNARAIADGTAGEQFAISHSKLMRGPSLMLGGWADAVMVADAQASADIRIVDGDARKLVDIWDERVSLARCRYVFTESGDRCELPEGHGFMRAHRWYGDLPAEQPWVAIEGGASVAA